jgi:MFS family permease
MRTAAPDQTAGARRVLVLACIALVAVGLDPHLLDPGSAPIRAALRTNPDLQTIAIVGLLVQVAFLVAGGYLADTRAGTSIVRSGFIGLIVASALELANSTDTRVVIAARLLAWASVGAIIPFAIASIARAFRGERRASALGLAFAVSGIAGTAAGILSALLGSPGRPWPTMVACAVVSAIAFLAWRSFPSTLPSKALDHRVHVLGFATGTIGAVAVILGLVDIGDPNPVVRLMLVVGGLCGLLATFAIRHRLARAGNLDVDARAVLLALVIGAATGFAAAVPLLHLPLFFELIQGASPLLALLAVVPYVLTLVVVGGRMDALLARARPRVLVVGGLLSIAVADLALGLLVGRATAYVWFILPMMAVAAGSVASNAVRTALIFASVRSDLRASAAAMNEVSGSIGTRVGQIIATLLMTRVAIGAFAGSTPGLSSDALDEVVRPFRELIDSIGLPEFAQRIGLVDPETFGAYSEAAIAGIRVSLFGAVIVALIGAVLASRLPDTLDPLRTTWDLADERGRSTSDGLGWGAG